jgi:cytochrome c551/c552
MPERARTLTAAPVALDGKTLFQRKGCIACHSVNAAGLKSLASFAPELSALPQVAALRKPGLAADAYVRESIRQPQAFRVPGFTDIDMPILPLSDAELDTLVEFLLR